MEEYYRCSSCGNIIHGNVMTLIHDYDKRDRYICPPCLDKIRGMNKYSNLD